MNRALQQAIAEEGIQILSNPPQLRARLMELGVDTQDTIAIELILVSCPSVAPALSQGDLSYAEVNVLVSSAVRSSGLTVVEVRRIMGALVAASGNKLPGHPKYMRPILNRSGVSVSVPAENEDPVLRAALHRLDTDADPAQSLSDLERLAQAGNAYASYKLGDYYRLQDRKNGAASGRPYYQAAAELGYGPAYGALADYDINGPKKNLCRAAGYFEHPTALAGTDGHSWSFNAAKLLRYRTDNLLRCRQALILSALTLLLSCLTVGLNLLLGIASLLLALSSLGSVLYSMLASPYHSQRSSYYLITLCWLLAVAALV